MPQAQRKKTLSVVTPDHRADKLTVGEAADRSQRDLLVALRSRIAADIDNGVPAHALAPLSRQLRDIAKEIQAIDARIEEDATSGDPAEDEAFDASAV